MPTRFALLLALFLLCPRPVSGGCSDTSILDDLLGTPLDKVFGKYTWPELVGCLNALPAHVNKAPYKNKMLKLFGYRVQLINDTLLRYGEDCKVERTSASKHEYAFTCGKDRFSYVSFGSESATSDFDFSLRFGKYSGVDFASDYAKLSKALDILSFVEAQLADSEGRTMGAIYDSNGYPEIMDLYNMYYTRYPLSPNGVSTEQLEQLFSRDKYLASLSVNICFTGMYWLRSFWQRWDAAFPHARVDRAQGFNCELFTLASDKTLKSQLTRVLKRADPGHHAPEKDRQAAFYDCLKKIADPGASPWNGYALIASCHIFAVEAYATFGALESVKVKNRVLNCANLAESFVENFGMLMLHLFEILHSEYEVQKAKKVKLEKMTFNLAGSAYSSKMKYFLRMFDALHHDRCVFLPTRADAENRPAKRRWDLLFELSGDSDIFHHMTEEIKLGLALRLVDASQTSVPTTKTENKPIEIGEELEDFSDDVVDHDRQNEYYLLQNSVLRIIGGLTSDKKERAERAHSMYVNLVLGKKSSYDIDDFRKLVDRLGTFFQLGLCVVRTRLHVIARAAQLDIMQPIVSFIMSKVKSDYAIDPTKDPRCLQIDLGKTTEQASQKKQDGTKKRVTV